MSPKLPVLVLTVPSAPAGWPTVTLLEAGMGMEACEAPVSGSMPNSYVSLLSHRRPVRVFSTTRLSAPTSVAGVVV